MRVLALLLMTCAAVAPVAAQPAEPPPAYESFIARGYEERERLFASLPPEAKSALKREHASRWLARNDGALTSRQRALVTQAIALFSPEHFRDPAANARKADALAREIECALPSRDSAEAFTFFEVPADGLRERLASWVEDWVHWLRFCRG